MEGPATPPPLVNTAGPQPAGFWIRTCAHLIDSTLFSMIILPIFFTVFIDEFKAMSVIRGAQASVVAMENFVAAAHSPLGIFIQYGFPTIAVILLWRWKSATPGKMLLRLKIVDAESGGRPSTLCCVIRYFAYLVAMIPFGLGFMWVGWDERKQGWHDKIAGTLVIKT